MSQDITDRLLADLAASLIHDAIGGIRILADAIYERAKDLPSAVDRDDLARVVHRLIEASEGIAKIVDRR